MATFDWFSNEYQHFVSIRRKVNTVPTRYLPIRGRFQLDFSASPGIYDGLDWLMSLYISGYRNIVDVA